MADKSLLTQKTLVHSRTTASLIKPLDAIQIHQEAENALNMALHYLRQPSSNVPGARRKTIQALAAMKQLNAAIGYGSAANDCGRA